MEGLVIAIMAILAILVTIEVVFESYGILPFLVLAAAVGGYFVIKDNHKSKVAAKAERDRLAREDKELRDREQAEREKKIRGAKDNILAGQNLVSAGQSRIPGHMRTAETSIEDAISSFADRAFYPFWDSMKEATEALAGYRREVEIIEKGHEYIKKGSSDLGGIRPDGGDDVPRPPTPLPTPEDAQKTAERLQRLYEVAHKDFEFASIYATWKTNNILVAGFSNMLSGLKEIQEALSSIDDTLFRGFNAVVESNQEIGRTIGSMTATITAQNEYIASSVNNLSASVDRQASSSGTRQDRMIDLLENIQSGREDIPDMKTTLKQMISTRERR